MPTKTPDYTHVFTDVYLKELDYVVKRRKHMNLTCDEVEKELQHFSDQAQQESLKEIPDTPQVGVFGVLERFNSKLLVGLLGLLSLTTLWFSFKPDFLIEWGWPLIFVAWSLWFCLLKFKPLFLGMTETPQPSLSNVKKPNTDAALIGLALSGGGVRSSTFNLGLLQSLAKYKILRYCDYLSTVSGGGYIGSCLSSLLADAPQASTESKEFPLRDEPDSELEERAEVNYLRKTKNYLGVGNVFNRDTWHMVGTMLSSMLLTITIPLAILLTFVSILYEYNSSVEAVQKMIQYITILLIILLSIWVVIIRLRQVVFRPLEWPIIWLEGLLFGMFIFFVPFLIHFLITVLDYTNTHNDISQSYMLLVFVISSMAVFLYWWAEVFHLVSKFKQKTKITIFLESLVVGIFFIPMLCIANNIELLHILLPIFLCILVLRIFCQTCFQQVENFLELDKRISSRAFMAGILLALVLLLSFVQYLTEMFIEVQVNPETPFYITTTHLFGAFILTLVIGHLSAKKANKLLQKIAK
ncbi:patatin-like phospholipase family protein, partial [Thiotrichales bacterium HSG1]|nr:patatin-like phospholipase family protein [Thiotrichales bacterium HSG1]